MKVSCSFLLPSATPEGYRVIFSKLLDNDPSHYVLAEAVKLLNMSLELSLFTAVTSPGHILVMDMKSCGLGHLPCINLMIVKKLIYYLQEGLPIRLKSIPIINSIPLADLILNMLRPFMKKELLDLVHFHSTLESFGEKIPVDLLPNDYNGGQAKSVENLWAAQVKELEDHRAWFQDMETRHVNESARPDKTKNATDLFGFEGSFKKLDID